MVGVGALDDPFEKVSILSRRVVEGADPYGFVEEFHSCVEQKT